MARPLRIQFPGAVYHVMNRGRSRQKIFLSKDDYQVFLKTVSEAHDLWGIEVISYCLLSNHYHLCLKTPDGNLSRTMRHLDGVYTQRFNRAHGQDGSLFRGRYKAILISADEYLASVVRYIHLNPVEAGLIKSPLAYPWSSHSAYLRPDKAPRWLKVREVLGGFSDPESFHQYVTSGNEKVVTAFYRRNRKTPVLGGLKFVEGIRDRVDHIGREHPRYERIGIRPTPDRVLKLVSEAYRARMTDLAIGGRGKKNEARKVAMYLVNRLCDMSLQETARRFGVRSYGVVGWACNIVRRKIESEASFKQKIKRIERQI